MSRTDSHWRAVPGPTGWMMAYVTPVSRSDGRGLHGFHLHTEPTVVHPAKAILLLANRHAVQAAKRGFRIPGED